jgi:hypothetical protein
MDGAELPVDDCRDLAFASTVTARALGAPSHSFHLAKLPDNSNVPAVGWSPRGVKLLPFRL